MINGSMLRLINHIDADIKGTVFSTRVGTEILFRIFVKTIFSQLFKNVSKPCTVFLSVVKYMYIYARQACVQYECIFIKSK